jgi:hypothetical protein
VEMLFADVALHEYLEPYESFELLLAVAAAAAFIAIAWAWAKRKGKADRIEKDIEKSQEELEK